MVLTSIPKSRNLLSLLFLPLFVLFSAVPLTVLSTALATVAEANC
jgi:hypothetical protein